ncbi:MAG TPA: acyltransferase family protein [Micromonosporaceae bacterium]
MALRPPAGSTPASASVTEPATFELVAYVDPPTTHDGGTGSDGSPPAAAPTPAPPNSTPTRSGDRLEYVPGLDGLRAVAVGSVLLYHLGLRWVPGGFLGVDLFFVLSGFLITSLLVLEYRRAGGIRLANFWARRVRRLLPAALMVLTAVSAYGWAFTPRDRLGVLRLDALWTLFYGANWRFVLSGQSYFDAFATPSPLRHAWSLAIEEQFYLLWPLVVLGLMTLGRRRGRGLRPLAVLAAVGATVSAVLMALAYNAADPSRAYYGTDTRVFELFIGAGAAMALLSRYGARFSRLATVLSTVALPLVVVSFFVVDDHGVTYYRGGAVVFCVASALVVAGVQQAPGSPIARLVSLPPLVWLGKISYGVYLWHWPIFVWMDSFPYPMPHRALSLLKLAITLLVATASFYLVEQPIRRGRPVPGVTLTNLRVAATAPVAIALVAGVVLAGTANAVPAQATSGTPQGVIVKKFPGQFSIAVTGDSIARSMGAGFQSVSREHGWAFSNIALDGCPAIAYRRTDGPNQPVETECPKRVVDLQQRLVDEADPDVIFVHSRWELNPGVDLNGRYLETGTPEHLAVIRRGMEDTMRRLTSGGARVVWISTLPASRAYCERVGVNSAKCAWKTANDKHIPQLDALLDSLVPEFGGKVVHISMRDVLCDGDVCPAIVDGMNPRPDGHHFTAQTAKWFVPKLIARAMAAGVRMG